MPTKVQLVTETRQMVGYKTIGSGGDCVKLKAKCLWVKDADSPQIQWIVTVKECRPSIAKSSHFQRKA